MPEIKKDLVKLTEGEPYIPGPNEFVITDDHTISDVVRYAISCSGREEVETILAMMSDNRNTKSYFLGFDYHNDTINKFFYGIVSIDLSGVDLKDVAKKIIEDNGTDPESGVIKITTFNNIEI